MKVKTTIEVLGHTLTREEAEALYYALQHELKMNAPVTVVPAPYPVPVREPYPPGTLIWSDTTTKAKLLS